MSESAADFLPEQEWPSHHTVNSHDDPFLFELIEFLGEVRGIESAVTSAILASYPDGASPHGLECRVKHWRSLHRKAKDIVMRRPYHFDEATTESQLARMALNAIDDILRYSMVSEPHKEIPGNASAFVRNARDAKIRALSILNSYHVATRYKGFHVILDLMEKFGIRLACEVQFHSPESIATYVDTHPLYEEFRVSKDLPKRQALHDEIESMYASLPNLELSGHGFPISVTNRIFARP